MGDLSEKDFSDHLFHKSLEIEPRHLRSAPRFVSITMAAASGVDPVRTLTRSSAAGQEVHLPSEVSRDPSHLGATRHHEAPDASAERAQEDQLQPHPGQ